jgi:hypothetical protein
MDYKKYEKVYLCWLTSTDPAAWAAKEFYDGWLAAEEDRGARWRVMWFEWDTAHSLYADGYLACCDYHDEVGWPEENDGKEVQNDG